MVIDDTGFMLAWEYWKQHNHELRYFGFNEWLECDYGISNVRRLGIGAKKIHITIENEQSYLIFKLKFN